MRKVLRAAWGGINISSVVFLIGCIAVGLDGGAEKFASGYGMARSGITTVIIGVGFGVPTMIYETELPQWLKFLIHMGTGCLVMIGASMLIGWLSVANGLPAVLKGAAVQVALAFAVWGCYYISAWSEAKRINRKIKEKQQGE